MPYETGTGQLINQLTNPPNPLEKFGGTVDLANKLMDFRANQALTDIYGQSIDPTTGQVDLGKFNTLAQGNPAALWKYGNTMQQAGHGVLAQGQGTREQLQAAQDQIGATASYMTQLLPKAQNGTLTADDIRSALSNMPPGTITPTAMNNINQQLDSGANPVNVFWGGMYANAHAREVLNQALGPIATVNQGGQTSFVRQPPGAPGGVSPPLPQGMTPEQWGHLVPWYDEKSGKTVQRPLGEILGIPKPMGVDQGPGTVVPVPGAASPGARPPGPQSSAAPAGAFDTGDPDLNLIAKYESNYKPMAGWGGAKDVDLSGYPLTSTGFPDWKGNPGPQGNSTAAGLFQIEKSTWNSVAPQLIADGQMKPDFSVASQITVAKALKAKNGLSDWLPYNPQLAAAHARGEVVQFGQKPPGTQIASAPAAPTDTTPQPANPYAGTGGQGTYVPPGGTAPRNIATGQPTPPGGVVPQPPGPGQPTNINQPTPPVGLPPVSVTAPAPSAPAPPVQVAQAGAPTTHDVPMANPFLQPQFGKGSEDYTSSMETDKTLGVRTKPLVNAIQILRNNPNTPVGPAAKDWTAWQTALRDVFGLDISTQGATSYQELAKQLAQNANVQAVASQTDLQRLNTAAAQPNPEQSRDAIITLAAEQVGLERIKSAQYRYFRSLHPGKFPAPNSPEQNAQYFNMETGDWAAEQDPMAYALDFAPQKAINDYLKGLDKDATEKFGNSVTNAKKLMKMNLPLGQ